MKAKELRVMSVEELNAEKLGLLREQFNLRMQQGAGQMAQPHRVKAARRGIARVNTILKEKASS